MAVDADHRITFPNDPISYEVLQWDTLTDLLFLVAQKITEDDLHFDRIVSLAKGGWPIARTLSDFLKIKEVSSIGTRLYSGIDQRNSDLEIYQDLHEIKGERVLLLDDVSDTGKTLHFAHQYLQDKGVEAVTTATAYYKPHSVFKPDYFAKETTDWIVFPYEIIETSLFLYEKWQKESLPIEEIEKRLERMGCKKEWRTFLNIT